jgi:hypothetical protein
MGGEFDNALRCRNYAEELRIIAADRTSAENRDTLLKVAEDYDRIARSFESIDRSKRAQGLAR